jgi:hypothetical protein
VAAKASDFAGGVLEPGLGLALELRADLLEDALVVGVEPVALFRPRVSWSSSTRRRSMGARVKRLELEELAARRRLLSCTTSRFSMRMP